MSIRVLFTDLDGTLLNDAKEVTPGNQSLSMRPRKRTQDRGLHGKAACKCPGLRSESRTCQGRLLCDLLQWRADI